jgi:hypothetical protein
MSSTAAILSAVKCRDVAVLRFYDSFIGYKSSRIIMFVLVSTIMIDSTNTLLKVFSYLKLLKFAK